MVGWREVLEEVCEVQARVHSACEVIAEAGFSTLRQPPWSPGTTNTVEVVYSPERGTVR
jgi:hypothetical protein